MDDVRAVVLQSPREGVDGVMLLPHRLAAVPMARRALVRDLGQQGIDQAAVDEVAVVVSELLGNAVRHGAPVGRSDLLLRWRVNDRSVEIEVVDGGGGDVRVGEHSGSPESTSGRGLGIVSALSDAWGTADDGHGQRAVWASVAIHPAGGQTPEPPRAASGAMPVGV